MGVPLGGVFQEDNTRIHRLTGERDELKTLPSRVPPRLGHCSWQTPPSSLLTLPSTPLPGWPLWSQTRYRAAVLMDGSLPGSPMRAVSPLCSPSGPYGNSGPEHIHLQAKEIPDKTHVAHQDPSFVLVQPRPSLSSTRAQGQWLGLDRAPRKSQGKMAGPGVDGEASDEGAAGTSTEPGHGVQAHLRPERAANQEAAPGCGQSEEVSTPRAGTSGNMFASHHCFLPPSSADSAVYCFNSADLEVKGQAYRISVAVLLHSRECLGDGDGVGICQRQLPEVPVSRGSCNKAPHTRQLRTAERYPDRCWQPGV